MTIELGVILLLVILLVAQQGFYMWQTHQLLNKLMSRNYVEYAQTQNAYGPKQQGFHVPIESPDDGPDRVKELNHMLGMI